MASLRDRARLPVALLGGFLGSGKTTLVNALLADPRMANTAVAINEFGQIPLDHQLIDAAGDRSVVLANGCLCCNLSGDVEDAVMRIFARRAAGAIAAFERLIIEPSGLADPAPIAQAILRNPIMSQAMRLDSILCTVDALFAERHCAQQPQTRKQIALADHVLITKADLVDSDTLQRVQALIESLNPLATITRADHGAADAAALFPASFLTPDADIAPARHRSLLFAESMTTTHETARTQAVALHTDIALDWRRFDGWLRGLRIAHANQILRIKGILHVIDQQNPLAIHGIHHVLHPPISLPCWPDEVHDTRVILLTQGMAPGVIEDSWRRALPALAA